MIKECDFCPPLGVLSKPAMSKEPMAPVIYTKETVTLSCQVMEESTGWQYVWFKDQNATPVSNSSGRSYIISSVVPADSGQYRCQAKRASFKSEYSDSLSLEIKGKIFLTNIFGYVRMCCLKWAFFICSSESTFFMKVMTAH